MRLIVLLAWFDERPESLATMVRSLRKLNHPVSIVALDGAYALLPGAAPSSDPEQVHALRWASESIEAPIKVVQPETVWAGNEVEKRTELFRLGLEAADEGDWFFVLDADEQIAEPADLSPLSTTDHDAAEATLHTPGSRVALEREPLRMLFRAAPITVETTHFTYVAEDGGHLWGPDKYHLKPAADLTDLVVLHKPYDRSRWRRAQQVTYYAARQQERAEVGKCERCEEPAVRRIVYDLRPKPDGSGLTGGFQAVCDYHAIAVKEENRQALAAQGLGTDGRPDPRLVANATTPLP